MPKILKKTEKKEIQEKKEKKERIPTEPTKEPSVSSISIPVSRAVHEDSHLSQSVPAHLSNWNKEPKVAETVEEPPTSTVRQIPPPQPAPKKKQTKPAPLHTAVYLNSMEDKFHIHSYEIEGPILLTILTSGEAELTNEEKDALWTVRKEVKKEMQTGLIGFLKILHDTHMQSAKFRYIHQLPGLVHFMYVERTADRLFAPKISGLVGSHYQREGVSEFRKASKEYLRSKVWDLVFHAQASLLNGYHSMLMTRGDFQYSYRLWFEDLSETAGILPMEKSIKAAIQADAKKGRPLSSTWYQDLTKRLYSSNRRVKCYELYTLYLSGLNAKTITDHNNVLVSNLRSSGQ